MSRPARWSRLLARPRRTATLTLFVLARGGQLAKAQPPDGGTAVVSVAPPAPSVPAPLVPNAADAPLVHPLPALEEPELPEPTEAERARLESLLLELLAPEASARAEALVHLREADASWLPALSERFERLAREANKAALAALLERIRGQARELDVPARGGGKRPARAKGQPSAAQLDLLELVVAHPDRSSSFLRPLTEVLAYSRMFEAIASLPAARHVVDVYMLFGEFLRADTERALERMGDAAIAALIEITASPVPRLGEWAKRRLEAMGKHVASEAVQVQDPVLRADILRAYGKVRDVETARLLISFAASDRSQIRLAARQAVALLGEAGSLQLRDAYQKTTGSRAPREWDWQRLAQELFAEFDRQRLSELYRTFNQGVAAEQRGDIDAARAAFDQVLAWDPTFERGAQMAPAYLAFARQRADSDREAAALALRRAERLAASGPLHDQALSLRYTLDALALRERGIVDELLVQRARELDPQNPRAAALEEELQRAAQGSRAAFQRYLAAAVILALTLIALAVTAFRHQRTRKPTPADLH